ncbi:glucokinase, ROK family [Caldalkalibacillus thermarum TA2.A1]|uniref:Glucokinase n=1 Tax=Caldalkalibacillus thermarum (strain TA2.A1) TaxID=986075 RepID=F5LAF9_CALTT|nr:ROK family glucokinase [Caldalkalibacillus thermarum]EGL81708.1 glucokinase, ROK family [Caldalkalibacillus thermarum TA2.A1]QZT33295.1 ROK family glucokinase [Caldalkalibacillus thermarum TA2.A1]
MTELVQYCFGVDLGGTSIKGAIVSDQGDIAYKTSQPTAVKGDGDVIVQQMEDMLKEALKRLQLDPSRIKGVGIGAPAFMDLETGFVYEAVNLGWKNYPLKERLESKLGLPVFVDNDANTAALGEMWRGAGQGETELLCITLGTGLGAGVIVHGDIYHGARGTAGEMGHVTVVPQGGHPCNCGKTGCLETIASATGIVRLATEALQEHDGSTVSELASIYRTKRRITARDVAAAAQEGDPLARQVLDKVGYYLGLALANYAVCFNPAKIIIGGGVSQAGDVLFAPIRQTYKRFALTHLTGEIDIVPAILGNDAGVIGAAWLAHSRL